MKKTALTKIHIFTLVLTCAISFSACGNISTNEIVAQRPEQSAMLPISPDEPEHVTAKDSQASSSESEVLSSSSRDLSSDSETASLEPENIPSNQAHWQVYLYPDMPQPYIEVLKQYEEFMNADNQNVNDESVQAKLWGGEWKYLYDEICMLWVSFINRDSAEDAENILRYSLADLTGDGFPELIIAFGDAPDVIYNYSESKGMGMECTSSYYVMTIYKNGIVEYVSGGAYSSTTYLQFQEASQSWEVADTIAVSDTWDAVNKKMNDTEYYGGNWGGDGLLDKTITKEEYLQIQKKYVTEPMEFEWVPLAYNSAAVWHSYEKNDDFTYEHDFMASRDGQGYHWWIYLEAAYIMRDYGKKMGYDFTSDHWTVERIYPICGGYYNIVLSQNEHDISIDLLCHPDKQIYAVLYAQYEKGDRLAGVNEIPYASQLEWQDFDFHENFEMPTVDNPYEEICESSVSTVLYISLSHYEQETGYDREWHVRELFGRSPFFDYLMESEDGFVWFCVDIGQDCFTYVAFE